MGPRRFPIGLVLLFLFFIMIASHGFGPPGAGMWWGGAWLFPRLLFPFLIVAAVLYFAGSRRVWRTATGPEPGSAPSYHGSYNATTPEEILRERFARGEVTRDQYREAIVDMLKDRYVRGELTLEEYEARVNVVMGVARERKAAPETGPEGDR